jgi:hypothetical protein
LFPVIRQHAGAELDDDAGNVFQDFAMHERKAIGIAAKF